MLASDAVRRSLLALEVVELIRNMSSFQVLCPQQYFWTSFQNTTRIPSTLARSSGLPLTLSSVWPFGFRVLRLVSRPLNTTGEHPNSEVHGMSVAQPHKSQSIISVGLCWLKQSQSSTRFKGERSGPDFSMGQILQLYFKRGISNTVSVFGELHPSQTSKCWLVF